ncbi:MAG: hypothetical protein GY828_01055 [Candidatus Gracilibacteria bacterium]|nr:hypothetical protein [Candidatus Gracilibacteria bacterium]
MNNFFFLVLLLLSSVVEADSKLVKIETAVVNTQCLLQMECFILRLVKPVGVTEIFFDFSILPDQVLLKSDNGDVISISETNSIRLDRNHDELFIEVLESIETDDLEVSITGYISDDIYYDYSGEKYKFVMVDLF